MYFQITKIHLQQYSNLSIEIALNVCTVAVQQAILPAYYV